MKKLLALLLTLCLVIGMVPLAASAEGEETGAGTIKVGGKTYSSFSEAVNEATPVDGVITYEISGRVDVTATGWVQVAKAGLTDLSKVEFIGISDNAEICITQGKAILADQKNDIDVSFKDLKLTKLEPQWADDYGHSTDYFTCWLRNNDEANNTVTYTKCTFPNGVCNNQFGKTVFDSCEFTNDAEGKYNLWNYGGNTEIKGSKFTGTRGIKAYSEGDDGGDITVTDNTTFTNLTEKAAIVVSKPVDIVVEDISVSGDKGFITRDITGNDEVELNVSGTGISGNFNITSNTDAAAAKSEFNISGGIFNSEVEQDYCADGFEVKAGGDGTYTVEKSNYVAKVGDTRYTSLDEALAALNETNHTLTLIDGSKWAAATPVYWKAGDTSNYAATLTDALKAAYMADEGAITIVCRPGADVGTMTHGHVADNITLYGNNAYISGGECDLEVDTYRFDRATGTQSSTGDYLSQDITITAYELDNLGVWGQRNTEHTVTVNLIDCDGREISDQSNNPQRVYISGTSGTNNITLTDCDFITAATAVYSNADGSITIDGCSFTGGQAPVNFNHEANGTQTVTVKNSKFENCGDNGDWKQFAAPIRFVNSGNGTSITTVDNCTFTNTVGDNGDILIGDGREGKESNDVTLTVKNTTARVQAQKPGYYNGESTDVTKMMAKQVAENEKLETSVNKLLPNAAKIGDTEYATLKDALESLRDRAEENVIIELLADQNVADFTVDLSDSAIKTLTIQGNGKKLDSRVKGVGIDGPTYCPVINATLPAGATFSVDGIVAPNSLLFDTGSEASLVVKNSTFHESQTGYPAAKNITYQGNTFEFKGDASDYYTNNAYPIWYKTETTTRNIAFLNNKVTGPRGFHIETRSTEPEKPVNIKANGNTFNLSDSEHVNKTIALQLVANLNGEIEFKDNQVNAYMGVCFFKGIVAQNDSKLTIKNNYTSGKLYGSSEWSEWNGSTTAEKIAAADKFAREIVEGRKSANNGSAITEGHTHKYVNGKCTICGQTAPSYSGGSSSDPTYSVSTPSKTENGTVTVSPSRASYGTIVTITVDPDEGYELRKLQVIGPDGGEIALSKKADGTYTFNMPKGGVTVTALFGCDGGSACPSKGFTDVDSDKWYHDYIDYAVEKGLLEGTSPTTMEPNATLTRAQLAQILYNLEGKPSVTGDLPFEDVAEGKWYYAAILWANQEGVVDGMSPDTFAPNEDISRQDLALMLYRYAGEPETQGSLEKFQDAGKVGNWAEEAITWAVEEGIIDGMTPTTLEPTGTATRAQAAAMLQRFLEG